MGTKKLIEAQDLSLAQGIAEDYVRSLGAGVLARKKADWRLHPPTPSQLNLLRQLSVIYADSPELTQGEVSNLIVQAQIRKRYAAKIRSKFL